MEISKQRKKLLFTVALILAFLFRLAFGLCLDFSTPTGALQGLVVGLPLYLLPLPEAPYVLLNILSFASLCFFAWYCSKRLPEIPKWFVWVWLLTAPWTLGISTHVFNPSYVLPAAILFFVCAIETYPFLTRGLIPLKWVNFAMGLSPFWVMQFHL